MKLFTSLAALFVVLTGLSARVYSHEVSQAGSTPKAAKLRIAQQTSRATTGVATPAAAQTFVAVQHNDNFALPPIVVQYDPATNTGYDIEKLDKLPLYQILKTNPAVVYSVRYLREAVQRMTGKQLHVVSSNDLARGIILTTLAGAPADLKNDPEVLRALRSDGKDSYNGNEAFFIRSEPQRLVVVTNTVEGFPVAVVELLESVGYEVLGMGPNWTHVPDFTVKPLSFSTKRAGRAEGFYIRQLAAASGQPGGIGTIFQQPLSHPADEPVEVSYYQQWLVGTRMASKSMPYFPGHKLQDYHKAVISRIKETGQPIGLLPTTHLGPATERLPATEENLGHLWINTDAEGQPGAGEYFLNYGNKWTLTTNAQNPGGALDLSVPYVREMILEDMKKRAQAQFEQSPDALFVFGTDPEDGGGNENIGKRLHNPNWYPEYLQKEGVKFGQPYVLHGFKGLDQPREIWDPNAPSDTVFGFNNWLLREFDQWIDSLPAEQRVTKTGKPITEQVRASLYSYNFHDVPANFNLDPRIRVMIAGYPKHRGMGKWKSYSTSIDMGQAFQKQLPREPSGDYWILSIAKYSDGATTAIGNTSKNPGTLHRQVRELYNAGFRAVTGETDFNFGRLGLSYYLYAKLLWNPHMSVEEIEALRDRWLQRSFGSGWQEMQEYYSFMAPESNIVNTPNKWARAIRMIEAADEKIGADESAAQRRLDDLKQFWYFYYLLESGQGTSDSPAMKEFLWKGQMSYMTAMHAVAGNIFKTQKIKSIVGEALSSGPAHYTAEETQQWWSKVLDFWKVIPVEEFTNAILADGRSGKDVDVNDLVMVQEFASEKFNEKYFFFDSQAYSSSFLTVATKPGEEIGFKLNWPYDPKQKRYSAMDVEYGISRWNPATQSWDELADIFMTRASSQLVISNFPKENAPLQEVVVRYPAPTAGTYRIDIGKAGNAAKLGSLDFDSTTDKYNGVRPFAFSSLDIGYTQSPIYFYIPKGIKSLDFELWGREYKKTLQLYTGLPGSGLKPTRQIEVSELGTHRIPLNPGEDGSLASLGGNMFHVPRFYSIPQLWAKSPGALPVPRAIVEADQLTPAKN